jgi:hypothetical protein
MIASFCADVYLVFSKSIHMSSLNGSSSGAVDLSEGLAQGFFILIIFVNLLGAIFCWRLRHVCKAAACFFSSSTLVKETSNVGISSCMILMALLKIN